MEKPLKNLLHEHGFSLKKAYGQNFLTDRSLLDEIVSKAGVTKDDVVLEIGCGAGALTTSLARKAKKVLGYEIDVKLEPVLKEVLQEFDNVTVNFSDVMKNKMSDIEKKLGEKYFLVANLPYYITTPIVMRFLEEAKNIKGMIIMVQEEVALRFAAKEGTADYGAITVGINLRGSSEIVMRVPRDKFTPPPNVDSAVVKITVDEDKFKAVDFQKVRNVVRVAFSSRRKMLVNNLMNGFKLPRVAAEEALDRVGIEKTVRGEALSAEDFVKLTDAVYECLEA
ncbi:MAG: ribosomal RNA small subunit methyltransferase A [Clostridia bacterium]|nr:ribosomal RNA small subunit methyltransferase A [Clostridia bacterium]